MAVAKLLLENGADPNIVCKDTTPLWLACFRGLTEIVYPLLDNGADPNVLCSDSSPLHVAAARGLVEVCEILLEYPRGADINFTSERLGTALHVAVSRGHRFVLEVLLKHNPDLNVTTRFGETVLHLACRQEDDIIAMQLLKSGLPIDPFIREESHKSTIAHETATQRVFRHIINRWPQLLHTLDAYERSPAFYAPDGIVPLLTSMTSKMVEHCGQILYDDIPHLADFRIICRQSDDALDVFNDATETRP